jgi:hypothetical protein
MTRDEKIFTRRLKGALGIAKSKSTNSGDNVLAFPGCSKPATPKFKPAPFFFADACECAVRGYVMHKMAPQLKGPNARTTIAGELYKAIVAGAINRKFDDDTELSAKEWREAVRAVGVEPPKSVRITGLAYERYKYRHLYPYWSDAQVEARAVYSADLRRRAIACLSEVRARAT